MIHVNMEAGVMVLFTAIVLKAMLEQLVNLKVGIFFYLISVFISHSNMYIYIILIFRVQ